MGYNRLEGENSLVNEREIRLAVGEGFVVDDIFAFRLRRATNAQESISFYAKRKIPIIPVNPRPRAENDPQRTVSEPERIGVMGTDFRFVDDTAYIGENKLYEFSMSDNENSFKIRSTNPIKLTQIPRTVSPDVLLAQIQSRSQNPQ